MHENYLTLTSLHVIHDDTHADRPWLVQPAPRRASGKTILSEPASGASPWLLVIRSRHFFGCNQRNIPNSMKCRSTSTRWVCLFVHLKSLDFVYFSKLGKPTTNVKHISKCNAPNAVPTLTMKLMMLAFSLIDSCFQLEFASVIFQWACLLSKLYRIQDNVT